MISRLPLAALAAAVIGIVLWDAFETIVLPRRVTRRVRLARMFYRTTWVPWRAAARRLRPGARRETLLAVFGPLSLILLLALWAAGLILAFGAMHWSMGSTMAGVEGPPGFGSCVYLSGTTFFTLGLGDVAPGNPLARWLTVIESGLGFGFLALMIGYFPVLYAAFSRREVSITLLDPRAGSPPVVEELIRRHGRDHLHHLEQFLYEWERWIAELMESHLSYPVLAYFRSQHANQSWLGAVTTVLDACALFMACAREDATWQARVTFAMARHAVVDLARVFHLEACAPEPERLTATSRDRLFGMIAAAGRPPADPARAARRLDELRATYEPYVHALARHLLMPLPAWSSGETTGQEKSGRT